MINSYISLALALIFTAVGQVMYKLYINSKRLIHYLITIISFILIPLFSFFALRHLSLDLVYISTSLTIILILFLSVIIFKEKITFGQFMGSLLIVIGIVIYTLK